MSAQSFIRSGLMLSSPGAFLVFNFEISSNTSSLVTRFAEKELLFGIFRKASKEVFVDLIFCPTFLPMEQKNWFKELAISTSCFNFVLFSP